EATLSAYDLLSVEAQADLTIEKALLDSLLEEIIDLEAIAQATASVVIAENTNLQADVDTAQALVTALPIGTEKTALQDRLDAVQNIIIAVSTFQSDYASVLALTVGTVEVSDKASVDAAIAAYDLLSAGAKAELTAEKALLDSLIIEITLQEATASVIIVENTNLQADLDTAQALVTALPNGTEKTALQDRLDAVQDTIDSLAASSVDNLITSIPVTGEISLDDNIQIEAARSAYDALTAIQKSLVQYEALLTSAESELTTLQTATDSVLIAEGSNLQADLDTAQVLVTALPNGTEKTALQDRLDAVQDIIDVEEAKQIIISYFSSNFVIVQRFNSDLIKEDAFISKANEITIGLDVVISVVNTVKIDRTNSTYTINITKNGAIVTIDVDVIFSR
ncbi:MAG: hypothetical protein PF513_07500, partial [Tenericutes bacterium]|nr:hypothetical protein [Mycoplasmatota bacterium]